jgi:hypothetical protein
MDPTTMNEAVGVKLPGGPQSSVWVPVKGTEGDYDVAYRLCRTRNYSAGTIITVDGTKFKVVSQEPPEIVEVKSTRSAPPPPMQVEGEPVTPKPKPKSERPPAIEVQVGQRWVTKDPRRKQEPFEVVKIEGDALITDKGAKIGLHRLSRYKMVQP